MKSSVAEKILAVAREYCDNDVNNKHRTLRWLFRDADDFVDVFVLLDHVEHERRNCFARKRETHFRRSGFATSVSQVIILCETRRPGDGPVQAVGSHDF